MLIIIIYTLNELVQGRLKEGKETYAFFLDVQKAYDSVWRNIVGTEQFCQHLSHM